MKGILKKLVFISVFLLCAHSGFSQNAKIDSLKALLPDAKEIRLADLYIQLAKEYTFIDPSMIVYYADLALPIAIKAKDKPRECQAYLYKGAGYISNGSFEQGRTFVEKGDSLAQILGNDEFIVLAKNSFAAYYQNVGNYEKALKIYREAQIIAEAQGMTDRVAVIDLSIGTIYTYQGDRANSLKYLLRALKYFEVHSDKRVEARVVNNIAVNYQYWKDFDNALMYFQMTLEIYEELHDYVGLAVANNNIGDVYKDQGDYDKAIYHFEKVINYADSIAGSEYYKAYGWIGLAETYMYLGEYKRSDRYIGLALPVFEKVNMQEGIANAYLILSQISLHLGYLDQAIRQVDTTQKIAMDAGNVDLEQRVYQVKTEVYKKQGRFDKAYENLQKSSQIAEKLYQASISESYKQLRSEMEINRKQNDIDILQRDNQIKDLKIRRQRSGSLILALCAFFLFLVVIIMFSFIRSRRKANELLKEKNRKIGVQHKELLAVNETKDKFLSIIGHDLRNPIGAFKDVIGQLADFPEMFTDDLRQQIIEELRGEAESTYFLLDNLLSWAKSQKEAITYKAEKLDIPLLVKNNIQLNKRQSEGKQILVAVDIPEHLMAYADHNMVNLILRNLLSNAIKFTEEGGEVLITVLEKEELVEISISDTGIGIPQDDIPKIFDATNHLSTYGTNHEKGSGLGLLLCKEFVETNGGTISIQSEEGKGSTFTFTLKKYSDKI